MMLSMTLKWKNELEIMDALLYGSFKYEHDQAQFKSASAISSYRTIVTQTIIVLKRLRTRCAR